MVFPSPPAPVSSIQDVVGSTPLVRLSRLFPSTEVFAKLESFNPGGSAKDRPALNMLRDALDTGRLQPGGTVVESSSGNLGMALARACTLAGVRFICVVDSRANRSTVATIRALGGEVSLVDTPDPETGDLLRARHLRVAELLRTIPGAISLDQYSNPANPAAHRDGTMREVAGALDHRVDHLFVAVSTTGTINGCTDYLREHDMATRVVAVDAVGSVLFDGEQGTRLLPGMGAGVVSPLSRLVIPDEVVRVTDAQAVAGCRALAIREGILAGASGGAVVWALSHARFSTGDRVAAILHDGGSAYLDTVHDDAWVTQELGLSRTDLDELVAEVAS